MDLHKLLLLKRKEAEDQLSEAQRARMAADPELTALREEGLALEGLQASAPPAPPWDTLRAQVIARAENAEETTMRLTTLFAGRHGWVMRFAAITIVLAVLASGIFAFRAMTPKAWATTNGYVLSFSLPPADHVDGEDCRCTNWDECSHKYIGDFGRLIAAWAAERGEQVGMPPHSDISGARLKMFTKTVFISGNGGAGEGLYRMDATLTGFSDEELESLLQEIKADPVLPEPQVSSATYYHIGEMNGDFAYSFNVCGNTFHFPEYASAEEIEQQINSWIEAEYGTPGNLSIEIEVNDKGGKTITISGDVSLGGSGESCVPAACDVT